MKKILALILASLMLVACVACGNNQTDDTTVDNTVTDAPETDAPETDAPETDAPETDAPETDAPAVDTPVAENALEIVNKIIGSFTDAEKEEIYLSVAGGYGENMSWDAPGSHPINDEDSRASAMTFFCVDEAILNMIDGEIGMAMNPMATRNLMVGCFRVADTVKVDECAEAVKNAVLSTQWVCGSPEKYVLITIDDYVLSMYGAAIQLDAIVAKVQTLYETATVVANEAIA